MKDKDIGSSLISILIAGFVIANNNKKRKYLN